MHAGGPVVHVLALVVVEEPHPSALEHIIGAPAEVRHGHPRAVVDPQVSAVVHARRPHSSVEHQPRYPNVEPAVHVVVRVHRDPRHRDLLAPGSDLGGADAGGDGRRVRGHEHFQLARAPGSRKDGVGADESAGADLEALGALEGNHKLVRPGIHRHALERARFRGRLRADLVLLLPQHVVVHVRRRERDHVAGVLVHAGAELGGGDALAAAAPHAAGLRAAAAPHRLRLRRLVPPPVVVVGLDQPRARDRSHARQRDLGLDLALALRQKLRSIASVVLHGGQHQPHLLHRDQAIGVEVQPREERREMRQHRLVHVQAVVPVQVQHKGSSARHLKVVLVRHVPAPEDVKPGHNVVRNVSDRPVAKHLLVQLHLDSVRLFGLHGREPPVQVLIGHPDELEGGGEGRLRREHRHHVSGEFVDEDEPELPHVDGVLAAREILLKGIRHVPHRQVVRGLVHYQRLVLGKVEALILVDIIVHNKHVQVIVREDRLVHAVAAVHPAVGGDALRVAHAIADVGGVAARSAVGHVNDLGAWTPACSCQAASDTDS
mmetsp:Transcript_31900/g.76177  ORF Transcript_31900/g.76177 Transcript_31900/m.76177 type:complete len:547 (+) Transcript_31900:1126-2766(+)